MKILSPLLKFPLFWVITIIISAFGYQQEYRTKIETPTFGLEYELNGKVKSVDVHFYKVEEKFGELVKGKRENFRYKYYINEKGNLTRKEVYDSNNNLYGVTVYSYKTGLLEHFKYLDSDGAIDDITQYKYDKKGNRIRSDHFGSENNLKWFYNMSYNDAGYLIEKNRYEPNGQLHSKDKYLYDNNGNMTEHSSYHSNGHLKYKYIYEYDKNGNETKITRYNSKKEIEMNEVYLYDPKSNLLNEMHKYNAEGKKSYSSLYLYNDEKDITKIESLLDEKFQYRYDQRKNWIEKISFLDGFPETLTERIIEYY